MERKCIVCDTDIPKGRVAALPNARTCVEHSTTEAYHGRIVSTGTNADNAQQDIMIIRDPKVVQKLDEYDKCVKTHRASVG